MTVGQRPLRGFLLLPVSLLLAVIGALTLLLMQDVGTAARPVARETERARQLAEAGLAHALWRLNQIPTCNGYTDLPPTPLGSDQYQVTVSPSAGSPVTLTATATLGGNLAGSRAVLRRVVPKTASATLTYTVTTAGTGDDTSLSLAAPDTNFGNLSMGLEQGKKYPLLRFDLSRLPTGSRIVDAKLQLYRNAAGSLSLSARYVDVHRVLEAWVEGSGTSTGASWNRRDSNTPWKNAGGSIDTDSALDSPHMHFYLASTQWMEWNITSLVQGWVDGRYPNHGLMLRPTSDVSQEAYAAAEGTDASQTPKLQIKYSAPCNALNPPQDGVSGRVAWWKFNETSGSTAADAVAGHSGTITGGSWNTNGVGGGALAFNASGKVSVNHADDLSQSGDFTLAAWVNLTNRDGKRPVLHKGTSSNEANYAMGVRDGELYFEYFANNAWRTYTTTGRNLRVGTWYHLTATYRSSGREIRLYVDGVQVGSFSASFGNTPKSNTKALLIGSTPSGENFLGRLDDVQVIASQLDASTVPILMEASVRLPVADTYLAGDSASRNLNFGGATTMRLAYPPDLRPMVRFDLSELAVGTSIKRAVLSFHAQDTSIISLNLTAYAYPVKESWLEGTQNGVTSTAGATWNKRQVGPDLAWTTAGGTLHTTSAGTLNIPLGATPQRYWEIDITPTVQEWVDGVRPNHGLSLLINLSLDSANLNTRESPRLEPRLLISTR